MTPLLAMTAFTAAALGFLVEPLVARMLLPAYGGTAAVWTTALVFFQASLVAGYALAHVTIRSLGVRRQALVQVAVVVLPLAVLPLALPGDARPPDGAPAALWLVGVLGVVVGLPFVALSTTGPTTQRWFAASARPGSDEPYRLYAASNAGSLLGLLAYPVLVEPNLDLAAQSRWWSIGFAGFVLVTIAAALLVRRAAATRAVATDAAPGRPEAADPEPIQLRRRLRWLTLAAVPAALLVGVTAHLSTDVAAVPFLWIVPLALYLVSLILAYVRARPVGSTIAGLALPFLAGLAVLSLAGLIRSPLLLVFAIHLGLLLAAGLVLHGRLAADRPGPLRLTEYTLLVAAGGALGGLAAGILGPLLLPVAIEEHLALLATIVLVAGGWGIVGRFAAPLAAAALLTAVVARPVALADVRTFYGTYRVVEETPGRHVLSSGTTIHGRQDLAPGAALEPGSYYHRGGPLGQVLTARLADPEPVRIGAVGLGAGTIAAYGRPGDRIEFFEIDPAVVAIARDPRLFTYLADSPATIEVGIGDGRLLLEGVEPGAYDVLVMDAFSSDSVPVHLLTVEAIALQISRVAPGGVIAYHISNRYLDLEPVVAAAAHELSLVAIIGSETPPAEALGHADASQWVIVARAYSDLAGLAQGTDWRTAHRGDQRPWTDRFSDLWSVLDPG